MPGALLTVSSLVTCMHAGKATPATPNPRVLVMGQPTLQVTTQFAVAGCSLSGSGSPPCTVAQPSQAATRVFSGAQPLLLQDLQALCTPTGTSVLVSGVQVRVIGQ